MSARIEWSDVMTDAAYTETPGDLGDGFGNTNGGPALAVGEAAVVEASDREALIQWLEDAAATVRAHRPRVVVRGRELRCPECDSPEVRVLYEGVVSHDVSAAEEPGHFRIVSDVLAEADEPAGWECLECSTPLSEPVGATFEWAP